MKARIDSDTTMAANWRDLLTAADSFLVKGNVKDNIDYLAIAWLATNNKKYAEKIKEVLIKLCGRSSWVNEEMQQRNPPWLSDLETARNCFSVAVGYDAIYNELSKDERKVIVDGVVRMGIKTALNDWLLGEKRIHTLNSMGHNWWSACVGTAGIASLAVKDEWPDGEAMAEAVGYGLQEWYLFNGDVLQNKPKTMDKDGGMYESVSYANFGIQQFLLFRLAFADVYPAKQQPVINNINRIADWFCQVSYPRQGELYSLNFGDAEVHNGAESVMKLLLALGYNNPNELWYINQVKKKQHREVWYANTAMGAILQPDWIRLRPCPNCPRPCCTKIWIGQRCATHGKKMRPCWG